MNEIIKLSRLQPKQNIQLPDDLTTLEPIVVKAIYKAENKQKILNIICKELECNYKLMLGYFKHDLENKNLENPMPIIDESNSIYQDLDL